MMITDLPCDIEAEILSKVPTKSLAKFQTVCKRWNTLFKDLYFVKRNFGKSAKEVILLKNRRAYSVEVNLLNQSMEFRGKLILPEVDNIYDIFQCEGLVMCSTLGNTRLVVWNPCTGEIRRIKQGRYKGFERHALGYENSSHTYKILKLSFLYISDQGFHTDEFEIYEDSSDSWRVLDVKTHNWDIISQGVSLKGKAYWIALDKKAPSGEFILGFDFTTEKFRRLPFPFQSDNHGGMAVLSGFREQQLSVLQQNFPSNPSKIEIWVTDNNIDEANEVLWSRLLVVDDDRFRREGLMWVQSYLLDQENKLAVCCSTSSDLINEEYKTNIHIVGEDIHKQVYEEIIEDYEELLLLSYVPSLVPIHKNNPQGKKVKHKEPLPLRYDPSSIHIEKNTPKIISLFSQIRSSFLAFVFEIR